MRIEVSIAAQSLMLFDDAGEVLRRYAVSTASNGAGEISGSYCTPRGAHLIRAKIGTGQPENTVFVGRRPTGEIYSPVLGSEFPGRDWMLTRILWLSGCETGFNRGFNRGHNELGCIDTMRRYIYIHGSPDSATMGRPGSHGCIRMRNADVVELFELVPVYTPVFIGED
ncbi:MAG: L,D-transpeptidase [Rhodocyclaceae bacterium]